MAGSQEDWKSLLVEAWHLKRLLAGPGREFLGKGLREHEGNTIRAEEMRAGYLVGRRPARLSPAILRRLS